MPKRILKVTARERGVKNYQNLSKSELIKEINKLKPAKETKNIVFEKYPKKDELKRKNIRKSFRVKKESKDIIGKEKRRVEKIRPKKESKKILEIKKIVNSLLLNKKQKIKQIEKIISIPKKNVYKPIKISGAFSDNFVEYKSDSKKDKSISISGYLNNIREHLRKLINDKKKSGGWKIQLVLKIKIICSKNFNETRDMYSKSDNFEIMMGVDTNEVIKNRFNSVLQRYQKGLQESMRGSDFVFNYVESLNYIFHKIDVKSSGSYIETPKWVKNKKATINPQNKDDDKCFQYAVTIALNYDRIENHPERVSKVKPFINQSDWSEINFPSHVGDWKKFELNNKSMALNVLYVPEGEKTIRRAYKSKYNLARENQVILLMITDGEKWHYLTVRSLSALLKGITSNHDGDFYCLNCFHSYRTKKALKKHMKIYENKDACYIEMPEKGASIKYHPGAKSMRALFTIIADMESSTTLLNKHEMCGYSLVTRCSFDEKYSEK